MITKSETILILKVLFKNLKLMKISTRIFCIGICFSLSHFFIGQNFSTGIYTDLGGSEKNLIFYSVNGINYVIQKDYDFYYDDMVIRETLTHGLMRNGEEMNYTCGPFASYCKDGYFFEKDGESYYYDELLSAYEANISEDPLDTLNYLYVKVAELPKNWALTPDDRIGELGVINESIIYDISVVKTAIINSESLNEFFLWNDEVERDIKSKMYSYTIRQNSCQRKMMQRMKKYESRGFEIYKYTFEKCDLVLHVLKPEKDTKHSKNETCFCTS